MIDSKQFVEFNIYNNNYYGTSKDELERSKSEVFLL